MVTDLLTLLTLKYPLIKISNLMDVLPETITSNGVIYEFQLFKNGSEWRMCYNDDETKTHLYLVEGLHIYKSRFGGKTFEDNLEYMLLHMLAALLEDGVIGRNDIIGFLDKMYKDK